MRSWRKCGASSTSPDRSRLPLREISKSPGSTSGIGHWKSDCGGWCRWRCGGDSSTLCRTAGVPPAPLPMQPAAVGVVKRAGRPRSGIGPAARSSIWFLGGFRIHHFKYFFVGIVDDHGDKRNISCFSLLKTMLIDANRFRPRISIHSHF